MEVVAVKLLVYRECTDCTSAINRIHHRFFSENSPKTRCLKRTFYGVTVF